MSDRAVPAAAEERPSVALNDGPGGAERIFFHDAEMAEVALLLPSSQAAALERVARRRGLTVGQLVRHLIRDCLASPELPPGTFASAAAAERR
jgi:hypothetical protein